MNLNENLWQTEEFARRTKVTVRTLHYYDRLGLLKPQKRNAKGFRLYGKQEFARLQQITTLKFIGFPLKKIREILRQQQLDLSETLKLQRKIIEAQAHRLNLALKAIERAEKTFAANGETDWESFRQIIEVINMEQNWDWTKKYYSAGAIRKIQERQHLWSSEFQERVSAEWEKLFFEVKAAIDADIEPTSERGQELALRWNSLIDEFTDGDAEIRAGLDKMYADEKNRQTRRHESFGEEIRNFIGKASKHLNESR